MADLTLREAEQVAVKLKSYGLQDVRIEFGDHLAVSYLLGGVRWWFTNKREACSFLDELAKESCSN